MKRSICIPGGRTPRGAFNINAHFIAPNPRTTFNPISIRPRIDRTAYIGPFSSVIGNVTIRNNVFVAPNVSIRADEGTPFFIDSNVNLQDGVILHGLAHGRVTHNGREYSIYIGKRVSCAHGCIIHGPCKLGDDVFVGFHTIVLNAVIGEGCFLSHGAIVTGGIIVAPHRFVPTGAVIDTQGLADRLPTVTQAQMEFTEEVQHVNQEFPASYSLLFGETRCSCGLACHSDTVRDVLE